MSVFSFFIKSYTRSLFVNTQKLGVIYYPYIFSLCFKWQWLSNSFFSVLFLYEIWQGDMVMYKDFIGNVIVFFTLFHCYLDFMQFRVVCCYKEMVNYAVWLHELTINWLGAIYMFQGIFYKKNFHCQLE